MQVSNKKELIEYIRVTGFKNAPEDVWQSKYTKVDTWKHVHLEMKLPSPLPFPPKDEWQRAGDNGYYMDYSRHEIDFHNEKFEWLHEPFKKYTQGIFNAEAKKDEFVEGVKSIVQTYTTLAPALKAWQPLWDCYPMMPRNVTRKLLRRLSQRQQKILV